MSEKANLKSEEVVFQILNTEIKKFAKKINIIYGISVSKILELAGLEDNEEKLNIETDITDITRVYNMSKNELVVTCKKLNLITKGNKEQLIERIVKSVGNNTNFDTKSEPKKTKNKKNKTNFSLIDKIREKVEKNIIKVSKNRFGNFTHSETNFIFDKNTKSVIGKQQKDGTVKSLTGKDIEDCKYYNFSYIVPTDLNDEESKVKYSNTLKEELGDNDEKDERDEREDKEEKEDEEFIKKIENKEKMEGCEDEEVDFDDSYEYDDEDENFE